MMDSCQFDHPHGIWWHGHSAPPWNPGDVSAPSRHFRFELGWNTCPGITARPQTAHSRSDLLGECARCFVCHPDQSFPLTYIRLHRWISWTGNFTNCIGEIIEIETSRPRISNVLGICLSSILGTHSHIYVELGEPPHIARSRQYETQACKRAPRGKRKLLPRYLTRVSSRKLGGWKALSTHLGCRILFSRRVRIERNAP